MLNALKIIALDSLVAFEAASDERVLKLAQEIEKDGKLRNPLLVQPLDDGYLMLDDAAILSALKRLRLVHVPVQNANPAALTVRPWQRVVENWRLEDMVAFGRTFPRQVRVSSSTEETLAPNEAEVRFRTEGVYRLVFTADSLLARAGMVGQFVAALTHQGNGFRARLSLAAENLLQTFPQATAVVFPPLFAMDEIIGLARRRVRLPYGLIRVDQPGRILGVDYSLAILRENAPLEEKQSFLRELIQLRMASERTAYYDGYVLVLNN